MRFASALLLVVSGSLAVTAGAQTPAPQAYSLSAEITQSGDKILVTIYRDVLKERVEMASQGGPAKMITLYDFEARKVYWIMADTPLALRAGRDHRQDGGRESRRPSVHDPGGQTVLDRKAPGRTVLTSCRLPDDERDDG
ncbi:MAG: hypothetical protein NTV05_02175 [Acidobacteria bacterium]|nr:hypothetical protein [Acidobacteriota bacterium]